MAIMEHSHSEISTWLDDLKSRHIADVKDQDGYMDCLYHIGRVLMIQLDKAITAETAIQVIRTLIYEPPPVSPVSPVEDEDAINHDACCKCGACCWCGDTGSVEPVEDDISLMDLLHF